MTMRRWDRRSVTVTRAEAGNRDGPTDDSGSKQDMAGVDHCRWWVSGTEGKCVVNGKFKFSIEPRDPSSISIVDAVCLEAPQGQGGACFWNANCYHC